MSTREGEEGPYGLMVMLERWKLSWGRTVDFSGVTFHWWWSV